MNAGHSDVVAPPLLCFVGPLPPTTLVRGGEQDHGPLIVWAVQVWGPGDLMHDRTLFGGRLRGECFEKGRDRSVVHCGRTVGIKMKFPLPFV